MTTIAYRNGIIAADRLVGLQSGWLLPEQEQKLEYLGWAWVGASGSYAATRKLITWLRQAGPEAQKAIDGPGEVDARAIVMHTTNGRARIFDGNNNGWESDWTSGPLTTGSGGIIALAAMLAHRRDVSLA